MAIKIELTRFKIKPGKEPRVDEWIQLLNQHHDECLQTLEREKMYIESIFREKIDGEEYLLWYTINDDSGESVSTSSLWIDEQHVAFSKECLEYEPRPIDLKPVVHLVNKKIYHLHSQ